MQYFYSLLYPQSSLFCGLSELGQSKVASTGSQKLRESSGFTLIAIVLLGESRRCGRRVLYRAARSGCWADEE